MHPVRSWPGIGAAALTTAALGCASTGGPAMTQQRLEALIAEAAGGLEGPAGAVRFVYGGVPMACISDVGHDRMRIVAPLGSVDSLGPQVLAILLTANYHTTLDGRYALSDGVIYAAYLHPLSSLSPEQLRSALRQVASLARTFGTTFSSGELSYGAPPGEPL